MRHLIFALSAGLSLSACITEDPDPTDAAVDTDAAGGAGGAGAAGGAGGAGGGEPACEGPDPSLPVCVEDADCGPGAICQDDPQACRPSSCECDADSGTWACTEDCRPGTRCVPESACSGPNPAALVCVDDADCGPGAACEPDPQACRPSHCECEPQSGGWSCTDDCGPANRCVADSACAGPDPSALVCEGDADCGPGGACVADPDACRPSTCGCDPESGTWFCTEDCGPGTRCVGGSACEGPNPAAGGCSADADCGPGATCALDPDACRPSACDCDEASGFWICTADCGPGGVCQPAPVACVDDFNCLGGFCDAGECRRVCFGDGVPAWCDSIPPVCAIGETLVNENGCHGCVDARTCGAAALDPCWGAWLDEAGTCRAPNDGAYPAECCLPGAVSRLGGVARPDCAPDDGPATTIEIGLNVSSCEAAPQAGLRLTFWGDPPPVGQEIDLSVPGFQGFLQVCPEANRCEAPAEVRLMFLPNLDHAFTGRIEVLRADGVRVQTTFAADACPRGNLGFCG